MLLQSCWHHLFYTDNTDLEFLAHPDTKSALVQFVFPSFCNVITNLEACHLIFGLQPLASMQSLTYFTF